MTDEQEDAAQPAVVQALLRAPPAEQQLLLHWARGLGAIRLSDQAAHQKAAAMFRLTRDRKATWPLLKVIARALTHIAWAARSWKFRLGLCAIIATLATVGNADADFLAAVGGSGLPLWVLTGVAGVLAGLLVDTVKKRVAKPKAA